MVPQFRGLASLEFLTRWLNNDDYQYYDSSCSNPTSSSSAQSVNVNAASDEAAILSLLKISQIDYELKQSQLASRLKVVRGAKH